MKRYDVISNSGYWLADIQDKIFDEVDDYLSSQEMTKSTFAKKLGVTRGRVSQILNGEFNLRLEKMIELSLAVGKVPIINFMDISEFMKEDEKRTKRIEAEMYQRLKKGNETTVEKVIKENPSPNIVNDKYSESKLTNKKITYTEELGYPRKVGKY